MNEMRAVRKSYDTENFPITWNIGKRCNYDCSYCSLDLHDLTSPHLSFDVMSRVIDKFASKIDKHIDLWFTGGEPTSNPIFDKLVHYVHDTHPNKFTLGVVTNGTRKTEYYINLIDKIRFVFSSHFEFLVLEDFTSKLLKTRQKSSNMSVNVMLEQNYWDSVKSLISFCQENDILFDLVKIRDWTTSFTDYTTEQLDYINSFKREGTYSDVIITYSDGTEEPVNSNTLINNYQTDFRGWKCNVGLEFLRVRSDGMVRRGTCGVGGYIGNVFEDFDLPTEPLICDRAEIYDGGRCTCTTDVRITKWKE